MVLQSAINLINQPSLPISPLLLSTTTIALTLSLLCLAYTFLLSPLSHIPGPKLAKLLPVPLWLVTHSGQEANLLTTQHSIHGPTVQLSPSEVSLADGRALSAVYVAKGGFPKPGYYRNFDVDGHATIFSETQPHERSVRAKAVAGLFALGAIRKDGGEVLRRMVRKWVDGLERAKERSLGSNSREGDAAFAEDGKVNLLKGTRALALDAVTGYLMGTPYGALDEMLLPEKMSAAFFVDEFVAVGRFFYLPTWLFHCFERLSYFLNPHKEKLNHSMKLVDDFTERLLTTTTTTTDSSSPPETAQENTYQARLLRAGLPASEVKAQCKDLMFAGTDSSGMNLATICWYLTRQPTTYAALQQELASHPPPVDPLTLPYLTGVVKEGLRLSMANPTRFPRVVPADGFRLPDGTALPPGAIVGFSPAVMHLNPQVFADPEAFRPERWVGTGASGASADMARDWMPFGLGSRACIARNLAMVELYYAVEEVVRRGVLEGARVVQERIEIVEWFNSKVVGERIEVTWR